MDSAIAYPVTLQRDTTVETPSIVRLVVSHEAIPADCILVVVDSIDWRMEDRGSVRTEGFDDRSTHFD